MTADVDTGVEVLGDLVDRDRAGPGDDRQALRAAGDPPARYTHGELRTTARKTGNYLSHHGVGPGRPAGVADEPAAAAVLSLYGTALLGGAVHLGPPTDRQVEVAVLVGPTEDLDAWTLPPGAGRVGWGDRPADPDATLFGRAVWSENPGFPPTPVAPDAAVLLGPDGRVTHRAALEAARRAVERLDLEAGDEVAVRAPLTDPGTVAAGVVAPLLAGGTVVFPGPAERCDAAVASSPHADWVPEEHTVTPSAVRPAVEPEGEPGTGT